MTKEEFITRYCMDSGMTREHFDHNRVALRCNCGDVSCEGWACVTNNPSDIMHHIQYSSPDLADVLEMETAEWESSLT